MPVSKKEIFDEVRKMLSDRGLSIASEDQSRPWGGFFVIDEGEINKFVAAFFQGINPHGIAGQKLSPKILVVGPQSRLSWQYHKRRAELWTVARGPVQVVTSDTDEEKEVLNLSAGDTISLKKGQRHRLIGLDDWGIIAEIWQHTDPGAPSDEEDIIRVQDDYNRQT